MKKINNLGFTLIELLAVITIMGILMLVAVPSVSRTIENSRRDTFKDNALTYVSTVRTAVLGDELKCGTLYVSATGDGTYYFEIDTTQQDTKDLMEKVAKSSWGNADLKGYVKWVKTTAVDASTGETRTRTEYYVQLTDAQGHGISAETSEKDVTRTKVLTASAVQKVNPGSGTKCTLR